MTTDNKHIQLDRVLCSPDWRMRMLVIFVRFAAKFSPKYKKALTYYLIAKSALEASRRYSLTGNLNFCSCVHLAAHLYDNGVGMTATEVGYVDYVSICNGGTPWWWDNDNIYTRDASRAERHRALASFANYQAAKFVVAVKRPKFLVHF